ncbi:MAG: alpha-amylase family glycosyl hydrolase [Saprospiraceae bacterium]
MSCQFKDVFSRWDGAFVENGWIAIFLSNHDNARLVNRFGNPDYSIHHAFHRI